MSNITKPFRPLLAAETPEDLHSLEKHLPLYGSYKLDGIRATLVEGRIISRSGKTLPTAYANKFVHSSIEGLDGELLAQKVSPGLTVYQAAYSAVMTQGSMEPLKWLVFDTVSDAPYQIRYYSILDRLFDAFGDEVPEVQILEQRLLASIDAILIMEQEALDLGHEGLIVRSPHAPYKQGRSTLNQGYLVKIARRLTSEVTILGFEELMHNDNPAIVNEVGYTKRSSHQENLRSSGMLGAFQVKDIKTGIEFKIGIGEGLDHALRKHIWENQSIYTDRIIKYDYKPYGTAYKPRQPRWLGWRDVSDM